MLHRKKPHQVLLLLVASPLLAQAQLVKDINALPAAPASSDPHAFVAAAGGVLLSAKTPAGGDELYLTAGDPGTTKLVKDISVEASSAPSDLVAFAGAWYFAADDGVAGRELWRTDGTAAGTTLVADVAPGIASSAPQALTVAGSQLFFAARDGMPSGLPRLYVSDGTAAGTRLVAGPTRITSELVALGSAVVFCGEAATGDLEPWRSDGTAAGTFRLRDVNPAGSAGATAFSRIGTRVYFSAYDGAQIGLYGTDGTVAGTTKVLDLVSSAQGALGPALAFGNGFVLAVARYGVADSGLWYSDGTAAGTVPVLAGYQRYVLAPRVLGGTLWFAAFTQASGYEPWRSDGTPAGTAMLADLVPGGADSRPDGFVAVGGRVLFRARAAANGPHVLWSSDGTAAGTAPVAPLPVGSELIAHPTKAMALFAGTGATGTELYRSDGTAAGTTLVDEIAVGPVNAGSQPQLLTELPHAALLVADDGVRGAELWRTDGTWTGTVPVVELAPGPAGAGITEMQPIGDRAVLLAATGAGGAKELWVSDATAAGTARVPSVPFANPRSLVQVDGGRACFFAEDSTNVARVWVTDGSSAAIVFGPTGPLRDPVQVVRVGDATMGIANDGLNGIVFRTDWSTTTTAVFTGAPARAAAVAGKLVFWTTLGPPQTLSLWSSDGTAAGTAVLASLPGQLLVPAPAMTAAGGLAYFPGPLASQQLWRTDGTVAGTFLIASLGAALTVLGAFDADLLFVEATPFPTLWRTDGTSLGTRALRSDLGQLAKLMTLGSGRAVLTVQRYDPGGAVPFVSRLWWTDGTSAGTRALATLRAPTPFSAALIRGRLVCGRDDGLFGSELWSVDLGATAQRIGLGCGAAPEPRLAATPPVLGTTVTYAGANGLASTPAALLIGSPPPALARMLGCSVYVDLGSAVIALPFVPASALWQVPLAVPNDAGLLGQPFGIQVVQGPVGNGLAFTNGLVQTVGR